MKPEDEKVQSRQDLLASWRLASLLAFNGFLISGFFATVEDGTVQESAQNLIPVIGLVISISVLLVAIWGAWVQAGLPSKEGASWWSINYRKLILLVFGPYILSSVVMSYFWINVLFP